MRTHDVEEGSSSSLDHRHREEAKEEVSGGEVFTQIFQPMPVVYHDVKKSVSVWQARDLNSFDRYSPPPPPSFVAACFYDQLKKTAGHKCIPSTSLPPYVMPPLSLPPRPFLNFQNVLAPCRHECPLIQTSTPLTFSCKLYIAGKGLW